MKKLIAVALIAMFGFAGTVQAQAVNPSNKLAWDQQASSLAEAQSYTYKHYDDNALTGVTFTGVVCVGESAPYVCSAPFPAFVPGPHSMTITAGNAAGESSKSQPINFTFVVIPAVPANLRIQ